MISIFVPPRSRPNRISESRFGELGGDETMRVIPTLGTKIRVFRCRQKRLQTIVSDEMDARHVGRELGRRSQMLRNVVDEERWTTGPRRQRLHRLALQALVGDDRKR